MQPVTLEIEKQSSSNDVVLVTKLSGKLSLETVSNFLKPMRAESVPLLVLDLSGVAFLDSAGVGALVQLFVHRRNNSQKLALVALTQQGHAVMQVSGLTQLIPTYTSVAEVFSQSN
ncbi:MAG TPA: STAS domain-containing protein [Candidatus Saccharimonadales bacterium]|nr:STAS domain-containing protein [Candidatus Saccharimonadales bacterium]